MPKGVISDGKQDGRSQRATGRTQQFATRVTSEWHDRVRSIATRDGLKLVEVLERAIDALEREESPPRLMTQLQTLLIQATPDQRKEARALLDQLDAGNPLSAGDF